jgi:hypothetical protein
MIPSSTLRQIWFYRRRVQMITREDRVTGSKRDLMLLTCNQELLELELLEGQNLHLVLTEEPLSIKESKMERQVLNRLPGISSQLSRDSENATRS